MGRKTFILHIGVNKIPSYTFLLRCHSLFNSQCETEVSMKLCVSSFGELVKRIYICNLS